MSEANPKKRLFAVLLLVLAGSGFLAYGSAQFLGNNKGWDIIQVGSTEQLHCGEDFMISYCLGQGEASASAEKRALSILYTDAAQKAYAMFDTDADSEGYANLYHINTHPNEILEVDEGLYDVFRKVEQYDSRFLYLAPVYEYYDNLFYNRDETAYLLYTGEGNESVAKEYAQSVAYALDPDAVKLELLGNQKVRLFVSEEYEAYAKEYGITQYINFYWMKNAFIADYLADCFMEQGFTHGIINSVDGYTRNLDDSGESYTVNLPMKVEGGINKEYSLEYQGPCSLVCFRNYPIVSGEIYYYQKKDGEYASRYITPVDGRNVTAMNELVVYSHELSCADLVLLAAPYYVNEKWDTATDELLSERGAYVLYAQNNTWHASDENACIRQE